jgi:hypothetical protein
MIKGTSNGHKIYVAWIPEKFAIKGKVLKLKLNDIFEDGWEVIFVGSRQEAEIVEENERDYLKQREISDV